MTHPSIEYPGWYITKHPDGDPKELRREYSERGYEVKGVLAYVYTNYNPLDCDYQMITNRALRPLSEHGYEVIWRCAS